VKLIPVLIVMGRWRLMATGSCEINTCAYCDGKMEVDAKGSCEIILVLIVMETWRLMAMGSCEINTGADCDGKMEVEGKAIM
jgi:hypothetical protein